MQLIKFVSEKKKVAALLGVIFLSVFSFIMGRMTAHPPVSEASNGTSVQTTRYVLQVGGNQESSSESPADAERNFLQAHPIPPESEITQVKAEDLTQQVTENQVKASQLYLNRYLRVTGTVAKITSDYADQYGEGAAYIEFQFYINGGAIHGLACSLTASAMAQAASLSPGQRITVQGFANINSYQNLILSYCTIQ